MFILKNYGTRLLHRILMNQFTQKFFISFLLLVLPAMTPPNTHAEQSKNTISPHDVTQGTLLFSKSDQSSLSPAPTLHTEVHITITGLIARTTVRQEFENPGTNWAEGIYVFPLPETAAVDHLRMKIGERLIEGIIKERAQAKKLYAAAKREGRKASLIEQERPNMFTTSVANIGPKETITIEIEYQETVHYDHAQFSLRFPMVVGPRYIPGSPDFSYEQVLNVEGKGWAKNTAQVPDASRITPPVQHPAQRAINPVSLTVDIAPGFPLAGLTSTYHDIHTIKNEDGGHRITLKENVVLANRDFELKWSPTDHRFPQGTIFTERHQGKSYALLMIMPPTQTFADRISVSRDITFVIDTSGSMHGTSIEQAKLALQLALTGLKSHDRFNIIQFNNGTQALFSNSQPVTSRTIQQASRYVNSLVAEGGTEMLPALLEALQEQETASQLRQVVFMTDGQIGNEEELFRAIQQHLSETRLFTVGIGSAPNSYFMRKASKFGRGTFTYIGKTTEVQDKMDRLFQKLEHPVLTDMTIEFSEAHEMEVVPEPIPDLYLGEPLMIALRTTNLPVQMTVKGHIGHTPWTKTLDLKKAHERQGLAVYWARQKISSLMNTFKGKAKDAVRDQVIELAMRHHLVSRYTSLVAIDVTPVRPSTQPLATHAIKTNLPYGQNYTAIFGLSAGATPGTWQILIGLLCILIGSASYQWLRTRT